MFNIQSLFALVAACLLVFQGNKVTAFAPLSPILFSSTCAAAPSSLVLSASGPATLDRPKTIEKEATDKKEQSADTRMPAFLLRLWNDPFNKREFVARALAEVCGKSDSESFQIMMQAHKNGMGVVGRYDFEIAELYLESLKEQGLLVDMVPVDDE